MTDSEAKYTPQNILVTGGAGFIASHVAIRLCELNYKVVVYDKLDYNACLTNLEALFDLPNFKFVKGDITSPDLLSYVLRKEKIDTILHFAAQTHVDNSFGNSFAFTQTNIYGTHVLLESAKASGLIQRFIHVSTDEVYGGGESDQANTDTVLEPKNPYAATKAAAEFLVKSYYRSFQLPTIVTRGNNVYGPHQFPEKLIPKFTNQLLRDMPLTLHGDGSSERFFLYVKDVVAAFETILHQGTPGTVYNIGGQHKISDLEVARSVLKVFGREAEEEKWITFVRGRKFDDVRYTIDSTKLHELGWKETTSWEEGLKTTVEWFQEHSSRYGNIDSVLVAHPVKLVSRKSEDDFQELLEKRSKDEDESS